MTRAELLKYGCILWEQCGSTYYAIGLHGKLYMYVVTECEVVASYGEWLSLAHIYWNYEEQMTAYHDQRVNE